MSPFDRIIETHSGTVSSLVPTYKLTIQGPASIPDNPSQLHISKITITCIAAIHDEDQSRDQEFRLAQHCAYVTSKWPHSSDSESTTVSVTHDFACVAKLNVMQLENPIILQLGTVGSQSIINFSSRALRELRPIKDSDAYLDIVNIDGYDIIISTLFMHKYGLSLDFSQNILNHWGQIILTLSVGQENLMVTRK